MMNRIYPNKYYSLNEILKDNLFPWAQSLRTIKRFVETDAKEKNILKAVRTGERSGTRYLIKGENIINYIANFEDGSLHMVNREEVKKDMSDLEEDTEEKENPNINFDDSEDEEDGE